MKEKGLFKDVLVLSNVPEKKISDELRQKVRALDAGLVRDVVEVTRGIRHLERAVAYFVSDKVICEDFEQAAKLKRELKVKEIITRVGTVFKDGQISGG